MESISHKVNQLLNEFYHCENGIICDNGKGNVLVVDGSPLQYDFVDSGEIDTRSEIEEQKIKFLNDIMDLFYDIQRYVTFNEPLYNDDYVMDCSTELDKQMLVESVGDTTTDIEQVVDKIDDMEL